MRNSIVKIKQRNVLIASLLFLYLPLFVFFISWTRTYIALICSIVGGILVYSAFKAFHKENIVLEVRTDALIIILLLILIFGIVCGWGGFMPQTPDWQKHNAILNDLVYRSWPVYYKEAVNPSMLTYNIGSYLIPALFGKIFRSYYVAEIIVFVWLETGLCLTVLNIFLSLEVYSPKKQVLVLIMLLVFNGCLLGSQQLYGVLTGYVSSDIRWMSDMAGNTLLQYKSNATCMRWIPMQAIPVWLIVSIWWSNKKKIKQYVSLMIPALLTGVLTFCGLAFIAFFSAALEIITEENPKKQIKDVFSFTNVIGAVSIGIVLLLYYSGNVIQNKPDEISFHFVKPDFFVLLSFLIVDVGVYCAIVIKRNINNWIFWGAILLLIVLPFGVMGKFNDLGICGNVPAMFVIMMAVIDFILKSKYSFSKGVIVTMMIFSSTYSLMEFRKPFEEYEFGAVNNPPISMESWSDLGVGRNDFKYNYFAYDINNNLFINYLARNGWE